MPWLKNNNIAFNSDLAEIYNKTCSSVRYELYRSRNPIDTNLFGYITMPFQLSNVPAEQQNITTRFRTIAMPRGASFEDANSIIQTYCRETQRSYCTSRTVLLINTDNNQAAVPYVLQQLLEQGWQEHDCRTALVCNPFHQTYTLVLQKTPHQAHVIIFTTTISDEFLLKLGAVLPLLYGYTLPTTITNAFLNGDKLAFITAFTTEMTDIIAVRRKVETEKQFTLLETYLKTTDTQRLERDIVARNSDITIREDSLRAAYAQLNDLLLRKASTYWGEADDSIAEFIQYLKEYEWNNITKLSFNTGRGTLAVQLVTTLAYWDEEAYKNYATSGQDNCVTEQLDTVKALLNNIFIDCTVQVTFHTGILLDFTQGRVSQYNDYLSAGESTIGIPHTHIYHHNCWGNNKALIEKAFAQRNYLIAWAQIRATLSGINLTDSVVFEKFCNRYMAGCDTPCLILKDSAEKISPTDFTKKYPTGWNPAAPIIVEATPVVTTPTRRRRTVPIPDIPVEHDVIRPAIGPDEIPNVNPFNTPF